MPSTTVGNTMDDSGRRCSCHGSAMIVDGTDMASPGHSRKYQDDAMVIHENTTRMACSAMVVHGNAVVIG